MTKRTYPITHWSYSSLMSFLRNPLAWHKALEYQYKGAGKEEAKALDKIRTHQNAKRLRSY